MENFSIKLNFTKTKIDLKSLEILFWIIKMFIIEILTRELSTKKYLFIILLSYLY